MSWHVTLGNWQVRYQLVSACATRRCWWCHSRRKRCRTTHTTWRCCVGIYRCGWGTVSTWCATPRSAGSQTALRSASPTTRWSRPPTLPRWTSSGWSSCGGMKSGWWLQVTVDSKMLQLMVTVDGYMLQLMVTADDYMVDGYMLQLMVAGYNLWLQVTVNGYMLQLIVTGYCWWLHVTVDGYKLQSMVTVARLDVTVVADKCTCYSRWLHMLQ